MDTPPRAFADDDDVGGYGKTPEPRRQRLENLERKVELLCREKGSLVVSCLLCTSVGLQLISSQRKLDADTKRFDSTLKAKMTESEEMRASLSKSQRDLERCKAEGEGMREEVSCRLRNFLNESSCLLSWTCTPLSLSRRRYSLYRRNSCRWLSWSIGWSWRNNNEVS